jgi:hypothetical protein
MVEAHPPLAALAAGSTASLSVTQERSMLSELVKAELHQRAQPHIR